MVDVHIQAHTNGICCHEIVHISVLEHSNLGIPRAWTERPHHNGRTAALPADAPSAESFFLDEANVWLSAGESFGAEGGGYVRMNLACSRETLAAGLERMRAALVRAQK